VSDQKFNRYNTKAFRENPLLCAVQIQLMHSKSLLLISALMLALGCSKDNASSGPTIVIKSYTSAVNNDGNGFSAILTFSQSGGNISGDSLVIIEHRYNQSYANPDHLDTFPTLLPITPSAAKAEFTAHLAWEFIQYGNQDENDTVDFKFVLIDQNLKHSDTVTTGKVIIYQF
jgi:hypothetical protein